MGRNERTISTSPGNEDNTIGIIIKRAHIRKSAALEIASRQVFNSGSTECRLMGGQVTVVLSPDYLSEVKRLDPERRTEHILAFANGLRAASEIAILRKPASKKVVIK